MQHKKQAITHTPPKKKKEKIAAETVGTFHSSLSSDGTATHVLAASFPKPLLLGLCASTATKNATLPSGC